MCTVTVVPRAGGFRLVCNRDELRTRPRALAPCCYTLAGRRCLFPTDPVGGGTWVGVNDAGLAMALLNRNPAPSGGSNRVGVTRGAVIPTLLRHTSVSGALRAANSINPTSLAPFQLVIVGESTAGVLASDGRRLSTTRMRLGQPLLYTSSSLGDARVDRPRRKLFELLVAGDRDALLRGQVAFHRHQRSDRPETSVVMSRADAATVSRTVIDVTKHEVDLTYEDLVAMPPGGEGAA